MEIFNQHGEKFEISPSNSGILLHLSSQLMNEKKMCVLEERTLARSIHDRRDIVDGEIMALPHTVQEYRHH